MTSPASAATVAPAPARSAPASGPANESRASRRAATGSSSSASEPRFAAAHSERLTSSGAGTGSASTRPVYSCTYPSSSAQTGPRSSSYAAGSSGPADRSATCRASDQSTTCGTLQLRQRLPEHLHGFEQIALAPDALEHRCRVEAQGGGIVQLLPAN